MPRSFFIGENFLVFPMFMFCNESPPSLGKQLRFDSGCEIWGSEGHTLASGLPGAEGEVEQAGETHGSLRFRPGRPSPGVCEVLLSKRLLGSRWVSRRAKPSGTALEEHTPLCLVTDTTDLLKIAEGRKAK